MPSAIIASLEKLTDLLGDPQLEIYQRLYLRYPDFQSLFILDTDKSVRGSMLQTALEYILIYAEFAKVDRAGLASWQSHHLEYGVEEDVFLVFFTLIRDCVQENLGSEWTETMASQWEEFLLHVGTPFNSAR